MDALWPKNLPISNLEFVDLSCVMPDSIVNILITEIHLYLAMLSACAFFALKTIRNG